VLKRKKASHKEDNVKAPEPVYYEEPPSDSEESSAVEYIEDDQELRKLAEEPPATPAPERKDVPVKQLPLSPTDEFLSLSVLIPSTKEENQDDDSLFSNEFLAKLPSYMVKKPRPFPAKPGNIESRPSMATSTTSEEHFTEATASASDNTISESCSASEFSLRSEEKKLQEQWRRQLEDRIETLGKSNYRTAEILMELGMISVHAEVSHPFVNSLCISL
jgi:hypothetical protein